ncbi:putative inactive serine protease 43 [Mya arenaria]|uniref:putative inactive serine protease 43 n=1 Tax=Mya arenaria TaxID=6604 RepID=UPI0022E445CB|nr:putative inactive serine protease 43 [Mya arenaria]
MQSNGERFGYWTFTCNSVYLTKEQTLNWERRIRRRKDCYAAGLGLINKDPTILPSKLQTTKVELFGRVKCDEMYSGERWTTNIICGYNPPKSTCSGDSGGPLVCKTKQGTHVQIGLTSFGDCAGFDGYPRVYSNIGWILRQKKKSSLPLKTTTGQQ